MKPGFDMQLIWRIAEQAEQKRAPTQEELAAAYGGEPDLVACARAFPASIEEIVAGICDGDARFLEQGKKLLKAMLRKNAAAKEEPRKPSSKPTRASNGASAAAREAATTSRASGVASAVALAPVRAASAVGTAPADLLGLDPDDYPAPGLYGD